MRSGVCAVQQTLTAEAASVLKHTLGLARRRGHAQVTPLHVAATLLSSRASSLRRACLKSQPHQASHPLKCRALELCFNVALNRLPTTPGPLLHGQPSLSNALIAALKRAQAHQRRGCIEQQQQQPLITIKVDLEQLIISILDDPSVSRVMREAGFSSTDVKNNLEDTSAPSVFQCYRSSGGVYSSPCSPSPTETQRPEIINPGNFWQSHFLTYSSEHNPVLISPQKRSFTGNFITESVSFKEDIKLVLDILLKKRKNTVIVGDSVSITEGLVAELMGVLERGDVPEELKSVHCIKFQFPPVYLRFMKRDEVEMNLSGLKRKIDSLVSGGGGAIICAGDLKWTVEETFCEKEGGCCTDGEISGNYSPVDHLVAEIRRLFSAYRSSNAKVWLMATASYQTHMRCQMRQPPLEVQWALQAVPVPSGGLGLSLHSYSMHDSKINISHNPSHMLETKPFSGKEEEHKLTCCDECASNYEKEAQLFNPDQQKLLPSWLQSHGNKAQLKDELVQLRTKWNRLCHCLHQGRHSQNHLKPTLYSNQTSAGKSYPYTSSYIWKSAQNSVFPDSSSIRFTDSDFKLAPNSSNFVPRFKGQQSCTIEFNFCNGIDKQQATEPSLGSLKSMEGKEVKFTLALGNSLFSDSRQLGKRKTERTIQTADISKLLQEKVPWQSETIPSIAEALIDSKLAKQNTWLLIQGNDSIGKRRMASAIAESVFGSADFLLTLNMRRKETLVNPSSEMLTKALKTHEKLVVLIEEVDFADTQFKKILADGFETGKFVEPNWRNESLGQAIFILTKNSSTSYEEKSQDSVIKMMLQVNEAKPNSETSYFKQKRKSEWDLLNKTKSARNEENEGLVGEQGNIKKNYSRQSSFNTLDLNIRADDDDESQDKPGESSPISSDLTREATLDPMSPNAFMESIENRFVFDTSPARHRELTEFFMSMFKGSLEEVYGNQNLVNFSVEEKVLEEVLVGSGSFAHNLFEKWLKDIFQTILQTVNFGGKEGIVFRLCLDSKGDSLVDNGYMGSCLPKKIQVNFMD